LKGRITGLEDISGGTIRDLSQFYKEYEEHFEFKFVDPSEFTFSEKKIFNETDKLLAFIGDKPKRIKDIKVSETMTKELGSFVEPEGLWEATTGRIIVKRDQLRSIEKYAGTLLGRYPLFDSLYIKLYVEYFFLLAFPISYFYPPQSNLMFNERM